MPTVIIKRDQVFCIIEFWKVICVRCKINLKFHQSHVYNLKCLLVFVKNVRKKGSNDVYRYFYIMRIFNQ